MRKEMRSHTIQKATRWIRQTTAFTMFSVAQRRAVSAPKKARQSSRAGPFLPRVSRSTAEKRAARKEI